VKRGFFLTLIILLFVSSQFTVTISEKPNDVIADVLIFTGRGSWTMGVRAFENFLDSKGLTWFEGNDDYINNNDFVGKFKAIHFPGGNPDSYFQSVNIFGCNHIRDFVSSGGGYIGICGGGYIAAYRIVDSNGNTVHPPLRFFYGTAYGPIDEIITYPGYKMITITINKSNPINQYEPDSETILYYGGAAFYPNEGQEMNIIGTYDSFNNDPAIINFNYGEGRVVLFGPHPEIEEDSDRDGETTFHFLEDEGTDWNLLWTCMDWLMGLPISEPFTDSIPPNRPTVKGMIEGNSGIEYNYTVISTDPEGDSVYYYIDWDDGTDSDWIGPYDSGILCTTSHVWDRVGRYEIKAKAKDVHGSESDWSDPLAVSMPKTKFINGLILNFLEQHPRLFPMLRIFLKLVG